MKKLFYYLLIAGLLFSCKSGDKKSGTTKSDGKIETVAKSETNILFKADGQEVKTAGWIVQRFLWDDKTPSPWLGIVSNMHMDKRTINVNLNGSIPGKYILSETGMLKNSYGMYTPDYDKIMDSYSFASGEFNLTEVDTVNNFVSGTFFGVAKNSDGKTINITEGKLEKVPVKPGVTNLSAEMDKMQKQ